MTKTDRDSPFVIRKKSFIFMVLVVSVLSVSLILSGPLSSTLSSSQATASSSSQPAECREDPKSDACKQALRELREKEKQQHEQQRHEQQQEEEQQQRQQEEEEEAVSQEQQQQEEEQVEAAEEEEVAEQRQQEQQQEEQEQAAEDEEEEQPPTPTPPIEESAEEEDNQLQGEERQEEATPAPPPTVTPRVQEETATQQTETSENQTENETSLTLNAAPAREISDPKIPQLPDPKICKKGVTEECSAALFQCFQAGHDDCAERYLPDPNEVCDDVTKKECAQAVRQCELLELFDDCRERYGYNAGCQKDEDFTIRDGKWVCLPECKGGLERVGAECLERCGNDQYRVIGISGFGVCQCRAIDYEVVDKKCEPKCSPGLDRLQNGKCGCRFSDDEVCGQVCKDPKVDYREDPNNCGACGIACSANQFCSSSSCQPCPVGATRVNLFSNECLCPEGQEIVNGKCEPNNECSPENPTGTCPSGQTCTDGQCVTPNNECSPSNPTGTCPSGQTCTDGQCQPGACPPGQFRHDLYGCVEGTLCPSECALLCGKCDEGDPEATYACLESARAQGFPSNTGYGNDFCTILAFNEEEARENSG